MDKRPKRSRDKYNPYNLHSEKAKNIYGITFNNDSKIIDTAINKEIFDEFDEFEKEDARQIQKASRNNELNIVTEQTLNKRTLNKAENIEEIVIKKIYSEKLNKALKKLTEKQRKRILLYYNYQLTLEKIARLDGCSRQSVYESIKWGIKKLKKYLKNF